MSWYDDGTADNAESIAYGKQSGHSMGLVDYSVGEVRRIVSAARQIMEATNADVQKSGRADLKEVWDPIYARWSVFYPQTQGWNGAFNQFRDKTAARAIQYTDRAEQTRVALRAAKKSVTPYHKVSSPSGPLPEISLAPRDSGISLFPWKYVLIGGGALVVGYGVYRWMSAAPKHVIEVAT